MKITKIIAFVYGLLMALLCFAGCGGQTDVYEIAYYDGTEYVSGATAPAFNDDLWRRNDPETELISSDPQVFDDTARSGYYYMVLYSGPNQLLKSKDLVNWSGAGVIGLQSLLINNGWSDIWALEIFYDAEQGGADGRYYMVFSVAFPGGYEADDVYMETEVGTPFSLYIAYSDNGILGDYKLVDYTDPDVVGKENVRDVSASRYGYSCGYLRYMMLEPIQTRLRYEEICPDKNDEDEMTKAIRNIDPHPWVDPQTGKKYMYFTAGYDMIGVEMSDDWLFPKYETMTVVTRDGFYEVDDWSEDGEREIWYEQTKCNEGPFMIEHNGKYYLTYSINSFNSPNYSVCQAVGDSPLGPFRKLTEAENGILLSADFGGSNAATGTGHHSFIELNGNLYIIYHKHTLPNSMERGRCIAFDEVKWVTIKDKDGNDLDVMYVNGPTSTVQPLFDDFAEYPDISDAGEVALLDGALADASSLSWFNDELLSFNTVVNQAFLDEYVQETYITETSRFEITFDSSYAVRGLMIYNSKRAETCFLEITDVELVGEDKVYYIPSLQVDMNASVVYNDFALETENKYVIESMIYGGSVYAEFEELSIRSIRFTVNVPEGQEKVGLSEIAVLGKAN